MTARTRAHFCNQIQFRIKKFNNSIFKKKSFCKTQKNAFENQETSFYIPVSSFLLFKNWSRMFIRELTWNFVFKAVVLALGKEKTLGRPKNDRHIQPQDERKEEPGLWAGFAHSLNFKCTHTYTLTHPHKHTHPHTLTYEHTHTHTYIVRDTHKFYPIFNRICVGWADSNDDWNFDCACAECSTVIRGAIRR